MGVAWLIIVVENAGSVLLERFVSGCGVRGYGFRTRVFGSGMC